MQLKKDYEYVPHLIYLSEITVQSRFKDTFGHFCLFPFMDSINVPFQFTFISKLGTTFWTNVWLNPIMDGRNVERKRPSHFVHLCSLLSS